MARVLIVEDDLIVAWDLQEALITLDHTVIAIATSGEEAIDIATTNRPDVILMDIHLSGNIDGITATGEIYRHLKIPVIYLTAHTDETTLQRAMETFPFSYLSKPWQEVSLRTSIELALQRHRLEQSVRDESHQLAQTLNSIADAAIATNQSGQVTLMNPSAEVLTGWQEADALGRPIDQILRLINAETRTPIANPLQQAMTANQTVMLPSSCLLINLQGGEVPVRDSAAPIRDQTGNVLGSVAVLQYQYGAEPAQDQQSILTKLHEQTHQLQQALACMQGLQRVMRDSNQLALPDLLHRLLAELGKALDANYCWLSLRVDGYTTATVMADYATPGYGHDRLVVGTQFDDEATIAFYDRLESADYWLAPTSADVPSVYQALITQPSHTLLCPLRNDEQLLGDVGICLPSPWTPLGAKFMAQLMHQYVLVLQPATTNQILGASETSGDQDISAIGRLIISALMAELHMPMTNIRVAMELLKHIIAALQETDHQHQQAVDRQLLWQKVEQYLQILYREWRQEFDLLDDVLTTTEPVALDERHQPLRLQTWLAPLIDTITQQARQRQQTLQYRIDPHLPTIAAYPKILERIITELLTNACKHSPLGAQILLEITVLEGHLRLQVSNTGVEIASAEIRKIFEPFYRTQRAYTYNIAGLGLGLAVVKKLVMQLNGDIKVAIPQPRRTSFVVIFPIE